MIQKQSIKIFLTKKFPKTTIQLLENEGFNLTIWEEKFPMTPSEFIKKTKKHDAIISSGEDKMGAHFLNECSHLKIISQFGTGYNNIDIKEATKLKIPICNTPNVTSSAAADISFGLLIATARNMFQSHKTISNKTWGYFQPRANLGVELKNKTLGILGLGAIGMEMAKRCKGAYDMDILYHNRSNNLVAERELNAKFVDFETLLKESDIISVHCSLNEFTKEIFNKTTFEKMKTSAIFINTSRGQVHNEIDLIEALKKGNIWGAGLDVTNPEPMNPNNPLLTMRNVCVLPHIGSATVETRGEMGRLAAENIIEFYKNKALPNCVNPHVLK